MTGHPETEHVDPIAGDVRAVRRDSRGRYGARKIKAVLERKGVTASRRRIGGIMREQSMTSAYTRRRSKPHGMRADEARLANLLDRGSDGYAPHARPAGDLTYVRVGGGLGVRVPAGRPGGQGASPDIPPGGPGTRAWCWPRSPRSTSR
jgi:putative transposase